MKNYKYVITHTKIDNISRNASLTELQSQSLLEDCLKKKRNKDKKVYLLHSIIS